MAKLTKEMVWLQFNALIQFTFAEAGKPGHEYDWARTAIKTHDNPKEGEDQNYPIPLEVFKQHLPQFYNEVIEVGRHQAYLYNKPSLPPNQLPLPPPSLIKLAHGVYSGAYRQSDNSLTLSLNTMITMDPEDIVPVMAHEFDHLYKNNLAAAEYNAITKKSGLLQPFALMNISDQTKLAGDPSNEAQRITEIMADRAAVPFALLVERLKSLTGEESQYSFDESKLDHPNERTRIKALIKGMLGDTIYGANGEFKPDKNGHLEFRPHTLRESIASVKQRHSEAYFQEWGTAYVAIDGRIVVNGEQLDKAMEVRAEVLMLQLDKLVKSGNLLSSDEIGSFQKTLADSVKEFKSHPNNQPIYSESNQKKEISAFRNEALPTTYEGQLGISKPVLTIADLVAFVQAATDLTLKQKEIIVARIDESQRISASRSESVEMTLV